MGDVKLFRYSGNESMELVPQLAALEKDLQHLMEKHLERFLGVRLLAHEYPVGRRQRGYIDSLGLDENSCPVILEYKRHNNENIICQGLYYLNWLMGHKAEFAMLAKSRLGDEAAKNIEFGGARVICVASAFSRYDEEAILQIDRNIELIRYRFFGEDMLMLEMLNTSLAVFLGGSAERDECGGNAGIGMPPSLQERVRGMNQDVEALYLDLLAFAENLGNDVSIKFLKHYVALSRLRNFTCIQPMKANLKLWLNLDPAEIPLEEGFSRDVRAIGHLGSGNVEVDVRNRESLEKVQPLIELAYQNNGASSMSEN